MRAIVAARIPSDRANVSRSVPSLFWPTEAPAACAIAARRTTVDSVRPIVLVAIVAVTAAAAAAVVEAGYDVVVG